MAVNIVKYGDITVMDISDTTATAADVAQGKIFYGANGVRTEGTATGSGGGAISVVDTTDPNGGTIRTITAVDISDTTAVASDVAQGKYFYTADGTKTVGTASGGSGGIDVSDTTAVAEDVAAGKYFYTANGVRTEGTATGGGTTPEITIATDGAVTQALQPDTMYHFTSTALTSLTISFAGDGTEQYHFDFISPATAVVLTLPSSVVMENPFSVEVNTKYEIDIYNNEGVFAEWVVQ